jgi:hypothetical protein
VAQFIDVEEEFKLVSPQGFKTEFEVTADCSTKSEDETAYVSTRSIFQEIYKP